MLSNAMQQAQALLAQGLPLTEEDARSLVNLDKEILVYLLLELAKRASAVPSIHSTTPSTPSGMVPIYQKPKTHGRKKKPGRKAGHPGVRRKTPTRIDRKQPHRLERCPDCGGPLQRCNSESSVRTRLIEDIPPNLQPEVVEHTIHRDYCPHCKKRVEPKVPDALPKSTVGHRVLSLSAYWHYGQGITGAQIRDTLNYHLQFPLTEGGMFSLWHRLAEVVLPWYEHLANEAQQAAVLHADETGWRVNGKTHWLWCFTSDRTTFYMIDRSRGSPALNQFFQNEFSGTLVTDFWSAYDQVSCAQRQLCLAHLLRELAKVDEGNDSEEWNAFSRKCKRLFRDALRLRTQEDFTPERYSNRIFRLHERLLELALAEYEDVDARRLSKRLSKYWDELLTFLEHPEVPSDNNHAEREIRFAVLIRKIVYGNRSDQGAFTQSVLMTVLRTLKRRGHNPIDTLVSALQEYGLTGTFPLFPALDPSCQ